MSKQANAEPNPKFGLRLNFAIKTQKMVILEGN